MDLQSVHCTNSRLHHDGRPLHERHPVSSQDTRRRHGNRGYHAPSTRTRVLLGMPRCTTVCYVVPRYATLCPVVPRCERLRARRCARRCVHADVRDAVYAGVSPRSRHAYTQSRTHVTLKAGHIRHSKRDTRSKHVRRRAPSQHRLERRLRCCCCGCCCCGGCGCCCGCICGCCSCARCVLAVCSRCVHGMRSYHGVARCGTVWHVVARCGPVWFCVPLCH